MLNRDSSAATQREVDRLLRRGIWFSIFWVMGVGSAIAVVNALKADRLMRRSGGALKGRVKVWWCYIIGGCGLLWWGYIMVMLILSIAAR